MVHIDDLVVLFLRENFAPLDCLKSKPSPMVTVKRLNAALNNKGIKDLKFTASQTGPMFRLYWKIDGKWKLHYKSPVLFDIITDAEQYFSQFRYDQLLSFVEATRSI